MRIQRDWLEIPDQCLHFFKFSRLVVAFSRGESVRLLRGRLDGSGFLLIGVSLILSDRYPIFCLSLRSLRCFSSMVPIVHFNMVFFTSSWWQGRKSITKSLKRLAKLSLIFVGKTMTGIFSPSFSIS